MPLVLSQVLSIVTIANGITIVIVTFISMMQLPLEEFSNTVESNCVIANAICLAIGSKMSRQFFSQ